MMYCLNFTGAYFFSIVQTNCRIKNRVFIKSSKLPFNGIFPIKIHSEFPNFMQIKSF